MAVLLKSLLQRGFTNFIIVGVAVVIPIFLQLGGRGLNEPDEGRYAEIGREMMVSGDWLVPRLNGVPHYAKPPWIYWCIAASLKIFGVHEWAARFPSALAAVVTVLTTFAIGRWMGGTLAGILSAFTLVSSLLFFVMARLLTPDMMLTACITLAFYFFWRWWNDTQSRSGWWLFGFYLVLGIGFLDKGLVSLGVCFLTLFGFFLFQKKLREISSLCLLRGLLFILLIALPWFLVLCHLNPDLYDFYLLGEVRDRILYGRGRMQGWFYHFLWLPGDCWPWTFLVACAIGTHFCWWRKNGSLKSVSCFLLAWFIFPLILFSASRSKLPTYLLPILPAISLMLGIWLARCLRNGDIQIPSWAQFLTWILLSAPGIGLWLTTYRTLPEKAPIWIGWTLVGMAVGITAWFLLSSLAKKRAVLISLVIWYVGGLAILHIIVLHMEKFETELRQNSSWRSLTQVLDGHHLVGIPIGTTLHPLPQKPDFIRSGPRVVMYEFYFRSSSFYLMKEKNEIVPIYGGNSLWEIERDVNTEKKFTREDLETLLKGPETVYVFSRPQSRLELQKSTGIQLPLIKRAASGKYEVVLFCNNEQSPVAK